MKEIKLGECNICINDREVIVRRKSSFIQFFRSMQKLDISQGY